MIKFFSCCLLTVVSIYISAIYTSSIPPNDPNGSVGILSPKRLPTHPIGLLESDMSLWYASQNNMTLFYQPENMYYDAIRVEYPNCPWSCQEGWLGDNWCDSECNIEECGFDKSDCEDWCGGECRPTWPGDGECDIECFKPECDYDGGDCENLPKDLLMRKRHQTGNRAPENGNRAGNTHQTSNRASNTLLKDCQCDTKKLGNGICDAECNTIECHFDKLDCFQMCNSECSHSWLTDGACDKACDTPECYYDKGDCGECADNCRLWMLGNAKCDLSCYNKECDYDQGDCDSITHVIENDYEKDIYFVCYKDFIGDGNCDLACLNQDSDWDGGDCKEYLKSLKQDGVPL